MDDIKCFYKDTLGLADTAIYTAGLQVTGDGISLAGTSSYGYGGAMDIGALVPGAIARDACGSLYIVNTVDKRIWKYEAANPDAWPFVWTCCRDFEDPVSIAVSATDLTVVDRGGGGGEWEMVSLSLANGQVRWQRAVDTGTYIAGADGGGFYLLDTVDKKIYRSSAPWDNSVEPEEILLTDGNGAPQVLIEPRDIAPGPGGNLYILDVRNGKEKLLVFSSDGEQVQTVPLTFRSGGYYSHLAVLPLGDVDLVFREEGGVPGLVRFGKSDQFLEDGYYISGEFDSTVPGCRWHRVVLDADIPVNTRIRFSYICGDEPVPVPGIGDSRWRKLPSANPADALLLEADGRYLRFMLTLCGNENGSAAPVIRGIKLYFPRMTYLQYFPGTYREDRESADFFERFLSLFQAFLGESEGEIVRFGRYLDPGAAPGEFVSFLASWLALADDENWTVDEKRELIRMAPHFYRNRGTRPGISGLVQLYLDRVPIIIEPFQLDCIDSPGHRAVVKRLYGDSPYCFGVLIPPLWETGVNGEELPVKKKIPVDRSRISSMKRIIDREKPAHTSGTVKDLEPWFYLDMHTYLQVNTALTKPEGILEKSSVIGRDTVLVEREPCAAVESHGRIGIDFITI